MWLMLWIPCVLSAAPGAMCAEGFCGFATLYHRNFWTMLRRSEIHFKALNRSFHHIDDSQLKVSWDLPHVAACIMP